MQIAIIGAGTMGAGIAQVFALSDHHVILHDTDPLTLRRALARISRSMSQGVARGKIDPRQARRARRVFTLTTDLARCGGAAVAIEAVHDDTALKETVLQELDLVLGPDAILATTTNTLSITALAAAIRTPGRLVGLHFLNPAHIMRLVEVIRAAQTRPDVIDRALDLVRAAGKTPVVVDDAPGWIVNRVAQAYFGEALRLLDDTNLDVASIDRLLEAAGFPMGPFRLMDYLGVDLAMDVSQAMFEATYYHTPYPPHPRLQRLIDAGHLGRKSGRGFYEEPA